MRKKTMVIVCIAVALCIVLTAGTAFAAPHRGGNHGGGAHGGGSASGAQATSPRQAQCTYPDCPNLTGKAGICINKDCRYYQDCPNEDCPRLNGSGCTYADCPFGGERPKDTVGSQTGKESSENADTSNTVRGHHSGGRHGGRHH